MRRRGPIESWKSKSKGVSPFIPPPGVYSLDAVMKRWVLVIIITMTIIIFLSSRQLSFAWCRRRRKRTTIPFHYSKQIGQWARIHIQCLYSFSWSSFNKRRPSTLTTDTSLFDLSNTYVYINKDGHFLFFPSVFLIESNLQFSARWSQIRRCFQVIIVINGTNLIHLLNLCIRLTKTAPLIFSLFLSPILRTDVEIFKMRGKNGKTSISLFLPPIELVWVVSATLASLRARQYFRLLDAACRPPPMSLFKEPTCRHVQIQFFLFSFLLLLHNLNSLSLSLFFGTRINVDRRTRENSGRVILRGNTVVKSDGHFHYWP